MIGFSYIRKLYGVSLDDVAQFVGVTNQSVSAWEQKGIVPEKRLDILEKYFEIPKKYFNVEITPIVKNQINKCKLVYDSKHCGLPLLEGGISDNDFDVLFEKIKQCCKFKSQLLLLHRFLNVVDTNDILWN